MADEQHVELSQDESGAPILLAVRKPGQVAAQPTASGAVVRRGAVSGNPDADPANGQFTSKSGKRVQPGQQGEEEVVVQQTRTLPQGMTEEIYERRQDIVRDAAREMDDMDAGDAKEFLKGRVSNLSQVNVDLFLKDVRAQRLDDLIDILDAQMRGRVSGMARSRRFVRVAAPKGWSKRVFAGLDDDEVIKMVKRLEGRGWDPADLTKHVISRVGNEERRAKLEQLYGEKKPKSGKKDKK